MARSRAFRRVHARRKKEQARQLWYRWFSDSWTKDNEPTEQWLGRMASTHCRPCSCAMCSYTKGHPTRGELASQLRLEEGLMEQWETEQSRLRVEQWRSRRIREIREYLPRLEAQLEQLETVSWRELERSYYDY